MWRRNERVEFHCHKVTSLKVNYTLINNVHLLKFILYLIFVIRVEAKICKLGTTESGMHLFFYEERVRLFFQTKGQKPMKNRSQGGKYM